MHHHNTEFQPMHAFAPYLLAVHQRDLLEEAEITRRLRVASAQRGIPAWRRGLGGILASAARSVDPTIADRPARRRRGARAIAA